MAITRSGGPGVGLNNVPLAPSFSGTGLSPSVTATNVLSLAGGETFTLPAGQYYVTPGSYTLLQQKDPITSKWRAVPTQPNSSTLVSTDGATWRLANLTGCALGAYITNVGSGYTSAPTVTASAGGSAWTAIVGGAINSTVTITTAGVGYTNPPLLIVSPPPAGGVPATATAAVSAGAISAVTVVNQGAGYVTAPTITVVPDPRDTITTTAVLTVNATLTGSGTITAVLCTDHGQAQTAVPTLAFAGGGGASAAATAVMCFTATGFTVGNGGAVYGNAQPFLVIGAGGVVAGTAGAVVNPQFDRSVMTPRSAFITGTSTAGGAVTATGAVIQDGGLFQAVPSGFVIASGTGALPTTTAIVTITVGGTTDTSYVQAY